MEGHDVTQILSARGSSSHRGLPVMAAGKTMVHDGPFHLEEFHGVNGMNAIIFVHVSNKQQSMNCQTTNIPRKLSWSRGPMWSFPTVLPPTLVAQ
jgi:hypothetical protein